MRVVVVAAIWLSGVVVAAIGVTAALSFLGAGLFGPSGRPLTQADVRRELARPGPAAAPASQPSGAPVTPRRSPAPSRPPSPGSASGPSAGPREFRTGGGIVFASCSSGQVMLTSWIPAQGYQTDGYAQGPAASAWVAFRSGTTGLRVTATCSGGHPSATSVPDDGDGDRGGRGGGDGGHGGGGGRGGRGSGGGGGSGGSGRGG